MPGESRGHNALRMRLSLTAWISLVLVPLASCKPVGLEPSSRPIDSTVLVTLSERLDAGDRDLVWKCRTERIYECANYQIEATLSRMGSMIRVRLERVTIGNVCLTALGPATCELDFGSLPEGRYNVQFRAETGETGFDMVVSADAYTMVPLRGESVAFPSPSLRRIPVGTIWGLIGYLGRQGEPFQSLAKSYLDSLEAVGAEKVTLEPGDYGSFAIDSTGVMRWPGTHGYYFAEPYVRHYVGDSGPLQAIVRFYGETQSQWLSIQLATWRGEQFLSWYEP